MKTLLSLLRSRWYSKTLKVTSHSCVAIVRCKQALLIHRYGSWTAEDPVAAEECGEDGEDEEGAESRPEKGGAGGTEARVYCV